MAVVIFSCIAKEYAYIWVRVCGLRGSVSKYNIASAGILDIRKEVYNMLKEHITSELQFFQLSGHTV